MNYNLKKRLFDFLKSNPSDTTDYQDLLKAMECELEYYDMDSQSISVDDLENFDGETLRNKLNKKEGEDYTIDDVIYIGEEMDNYIADEFGENLHNTIYFNDVSLN